MSRRAKLGILFTLIALTALIIFRLSALRQSDFPPPETNIPAIAIQPVGTTLKESVLALTGTIRSSQTAIVSAKAGGRTITLLAENGARVAAGQSLVLLDPVDAQNYLATSIAAQAKAEAAVTSLRSNYERMTAMFEAETVSRQDLEDLETALKVAEADLAAATAAVSTAEEALRNTTITAPLAGLIANRNVSLGQIVSPGQPLMEVIDISSVLVKVNIEQADLSLVKLGQSAEITIDAYPGLIFNGSIEILNPSANPQTRVFEAQIRAANPDGRLQPGMFSNIIIRTGRQAEVLSVPQSALGSNRGVAYVFVLEGDRVRRQPVEIGSVIGGMVEIRSGLQPGQMVATTNVNQLKDQDQVTTTHVQGE